MASGGDTSLRSCLGRPTSESKEYDCERESLHSPRLRRQAVRCTDFVVGTASVGQRTSLYGNAMDEAWAVQI
jgi:hypothetical protein